MQSDYLFCAVPLYTKDAYWEIDGKGREVIMTPQEKIRRRIYFLRLALGKMPAGLILAVLLPHRLGKPILKIYGSLVRATVINLGLFKLAVKPGPQFYRLAVRQFMEILLPAFCGQSIMYESGNVVLEKGDIVIDAGANLGVFSQFAAHKVGPSGRIYAFEPVSSSRELLIRTVRINNSKNIKVEPFALGNSCKELRVFTPPGEPHLSSAVFRAEVVETVKQITLDEFVRRANTKVDFIKANIEGMERELLEGAEETIRRFRPKIAISTSHLPDDPRVLRKMLKELAEEYEFLESDGMLYARAAAQMLGARNKEVGAEVSQRLLLYHQEP